MQNATEHKSSGRTTVKKPRPLSVVLSTRLPVELVKQLDERARARNIFTSKLIREILEASLKPSKPNALFG